MLREQLVVKPSLRVALARSDFLVFLAGGAALLSPFDLGPKFGGHDGPVEPAQTQSQIVQAPQVMVRAVRAFTHRSVVTFWRARPPMRAEFLHHRRPRSFCRFRVACGQGYTRPKFR